MVSTCICAHTHTCAHTYAHTHVYTHMHAYTHIRNTYTHTHVHTQSKQFTIWRLTLGKASSVELQTVSFEGLHPWLGTLDSVLADKNGLFIHSIRCGENSCIFTLHSTSGPKTQVCHILEMQNPCNTAGKAMRSCSRVCTRKISRMSQFTNVTSQ